MIGSRICRDYTVVVLGALHVKKLSAAKHWLTLHAASEEQPSGCRHQMHVAPPLQQRDQLFTIRTVGRNPALHLWGRQSINLGAGNYHRSRPSGGNVSAPPTLTVAAPCGNDTTFATCLELAAGGQPRTTTAPPLFLGPRQLQTTPALSLHHTTAIGSAALHQNSRVARRRLSAPLYRGFYL